MIYNKSFREHTNDLYIKCNVHKFGDIYKYNLAVSFYKSKQDEFFISSHNHFTRNRNNLVVPFERLSLTQQSVSHMGASVGKSNFNDMRKPSLSIESSSSTVLEEAE